MTKQITKIVVPCYNEAQRLDLLAFNHFLQTDDSVSLLFVNDGSTDDTAAILTDLAAQRTASIEVLHLPSNKGKAEAVRLGVLRAFASSPLYIGMWDADLATPLTEICRFQEILDNMPQILLVTGARVRMMGRIIERSHVRHYLGRIGATLISLTLGLPCYDTQCGAKLFRATEIMRHLFSEPFLTSWIFDAELLARMGALSRNSHLPAIRMRTVGPPERHICDPKECVYELPLLEWRHREGSKIRISDYLLSLLDLVRIIRNYY